MIVLVSKFYKWFNEQGILLQHLLVKVVFSLSLTCLIGTTVALVKPFTTWVVVLRDFGYAFVASYVFLSVLFLGLEFILSREVVEQEF